MQYSENMVSSSREGLERVKNAESYIFITEFSDVVAVAYEDCDYAVGKEEFFPTSFAWVFPENSPLLQAFNNK